MDGSVDAGVIPKEEIDSVEVATAGKGSENGRRFNLRLRGYERVFELMAEDKVACDEWANCIMKLKQVDSQQFTQSVTDLFSSFVVRGTPIPQDVTHSGFMGKKSRFSRHVWRTRYFVLCEVGLVYYR